MYQVPTAARWRKRKNAPSLRLSRRIREPAPSAGADFFTLAKVRPAPQNCGAQKNCIHLSSAAADSPSWFLPLLLGTSQYLVLFSSRKQLLNHLHWQKHSSTIGELYKSVLFIKLSRFSVYGIHHHGHSTNTYRGQGIGTFQRIQK